MQEDSSGQALQETTTPDARRSRKQDEFGGFIIAYGMLQKERTHTEALLAAKALVNCVLMPGDAEDGLGHATAMLDRLLKEDSGAWARLFQSAIETDIDATVLTCLKKLFSPDPSRLLVVKQVTDDGSVTLIGRDARAFWEALLSGRHAHRTLVMEDNVSIHLLESNEKLWL